jgi:hypothetical protein
MSAWTTNEFTGEGALRIPVWPARCTIVVGVALATLNYALLAIAQINAAIAGTQPHSTGSSH